MAFRSARAVVPSRGGGEDRAVVVEIPGGLVLALADGAGGTSGGAAAADLVVDRVARNRGPIDPVRVLEELDRQISKIRDGGQCTGVIVLVTEEGISGASVGDSDAWIIADSDAWVVGEGSIEELTAYQQRTPLLGSGHAVVMPFSAPPLGPEAVLLVGSDGLFKYVRRDKITALTRTGTLEQLPGRLVELARLPGGALQDDVAVLVCRR